MLNTSTPPCSIIVASTCMYYISTCGLYALIWCTQSRRAPSSLAVVVFLTNTDAERFFFLPRQVKPIVKRAVFFLIIICTLHRYTYGLSFTRVTSVTVTTHTCHHTPRVMDCPFARCSHVVINWPQAISSVQYVPYKK